MRYYAVIDTNVIVSAMLNEKSTPGTIAREAIETEGEIIPLYSAEILQEYNEVLSRSKFSFGAERIKRIIAGIVSRGVNIDPGRVEFEFRDPDDVVFYAVVMEKRKEDDAYLVTGNIKHFPKEPFVVTPKEMLDIIRGRSETDTI